MVFTTDKPGRFIVDSSKKENYVKTSTMSHFQDEPFVSEEEHERAQKEINAHVTTLVCSRLPYTARCTDTSDKKGPNRLQESGDRIFRPVRCPFTAPRAPI